MTAVVGLMHDGHVYIGADSAATELSGYNSRPTVIPKVFSRDNYVVGFSGSFRAGQILRHHLDLPPIPEKLQKHAFQPKIAEEFFVKFFIESVKHAFSVYGFENTDDDACFFLVGVGGTLVTIESDFQVGIYDDYASVGTGSAYALGSLYSTPGREPEQRINLALEAASMYNATVAPPFHIERT